MGYLGIVAGVLTILPFLPIPIVEAYWLLGACLPPERPLAERRAAGLD